MTIKEIAEEFIKLAEAVKREYPNSYQGSKSVDLAYAYLKLESQLEKHKRLEAAAEEVYGLMRHEWLGHQDTTCPKCILGYGLDEVKENDDGA